VIVLKTLLWGSLGALAWTHVGYPAAASVAARLRPRPVRKGDDLPTVSVIVPAHDEEAVIERRLDNLLALDYPADRLEVVVASDASTDRTDEVVASVAAREPRVRLLTVPRGGKVAAQDRAVRETQGEIVAFSDANATWEPRALRRLVSLAGTGDNPEGTGGSTLAWKAKRWILADTTKYAPVLLDLQDFRVPPDLVKTEREVVLPVDAGDVIFFHSLLWHASGANRSDSARFAEIVSFMGPTARFVGRGDGRFALARRP